MTGPRRVFHRAARPFTLLFAEADVMSGCFSGAAPV
jgi:hypothetical protein